MGSLAGLASLAGVNVSGGDISRLYPVILTSESVLTEVLQRRLRHRTIQGLREPGSIHGIG